MRIDFNQKIMTAKGDGPLRKVLFCDACKKSVRTEDSVNEYTLADAAIEALLTPERELDLKGKVYKGNLAMTIARSNGPIELELKDVELIQRKIGEFIENPIIVAQADEMLECSVV